ncbi:HNH endonuclease signature motif containing protein [Microbacterium sp. 5K110]|uniref:HNH endonuclease n=1 Tax=unclassified Microbacterium TaxID=2609290 RepID=UPI0010FE222F|nr:HNH endonuclease signature motif containing protein [Microbacterium sp. 5K110]TLF30083.1 DUF222 domain-containing protein [Microbacterium sp. 5K110]
MPPSSVPDPGSHSAASEDDRLGGLVSAIRDETARAAHVHASLIRLRSAALEIALDQVARSRSRASREREMPVRSLALEIAVATRAHDLTVQKELSDAHTMTQKFVATVDALAQGRIGARHAAAILETGIVLDDDATRAAWEQVVLTHAERESPGRVRAFGRELAESVHPVGMTQRHARAAASRGVSVRDLADGMAELSVILPATVAYGIRDRLRRQAAAIRASMNDDAAGASVAADGSPGESGTGADSTSARGTAAGSTDAGGTAADSTDARGTAAGSTDAGGTAADSTDARGTAAGSGDSGGAAGADAAEGSSAAAGASAGTAAARATGAGPRATGTSASAASADEAHSAGPAQIAPIDVHADVTDTRTLAQIGADVCADLLLTAAPAIDPTTDETCPGGLGAIRGHVQITVPVLTLLGRGDVGASIDGRTPIDPETARQMTAHAPGWDRVLCDPVTGTVLDVDRYSPTAAQRRFLAARDRHCRAPGCRAPITRCQIDHNHEAQNGGRTRLCNLCHLCVRHHTLKTESEWTVHQDPDGTLRFQSPLGYEHREKLPARVLFVPDADPPPF